MDRVRLHVAGLKCRSACEWKLNCVGPVVDPVRGEWVVLYSFSSSPYALQAWLVKDSLLVHSVQLPLEFRHAAPDRLTTSDDGRFVTVQFYRALLLYSYCHQTGFQLQHTCRFEEIRMHSDDTEQQYEMQSLVCTFSSDSESVSVCHFSMPMDGTSRVALKTTVIDIGEKGGACHTTHYVNFVASYYECEVSFAGILCNTKPLRVLIPPHSFSDTGQVVCPAESTRLELLTLGEGLMEIQDFGFTPCGRFMLEMRGVLTDSSTSIELVLRCTFSGKQIYRVTTQVDEDVLDLIVTRDGRFAFIAYGRNDINNLCVLLGWQIVRLRDGVVVADVRRPKDEKKVRWIRGFGLSFDGRYLMLRRRASEEKTELVLLCGLSGVRVWEVGLSESLASRNWGEGSAESSEGEEDGPDLIGANAPEIFLSKGFPTRLTVVSKAADKLTLVSYE